MFDYSRFVVVFELVMLVGFILSSIVSTISIYRWVKNQTFDLGMSSVINISFVVFYVFFYLAREVSDDLFTIAMVIYLGLFLAPLSLFSKYSRRYALINAGLALLYLILLIGNIKPIYTIQYHKIIRIQSINILDFSITGISVLLQSYIIYKYLRKDLTLNKILSWIFLVSYQLLHSYYSLSDYPNYTFSLIIFPLLYYLIYAVNYLGNLGDNKFLVEE